MMGSRRMGIGALALGLVAACGLAEGASAAAAGASASRPAAVGLRVTGSRPAGAAGRTAASGPPPSRGGPRRRLRTPHRQSCSTPPWPKRSGASKRATACRSTASSAAKRWRRWTCRWPRASTRFAPTSNGCAGWRATSSATTCWSTSPVSRPGCGSTAARPGARAWSSAGRTGARPNSARRWNTWCSTPSGACRRPSCATTCCHACCATAATSSANACG